ncbi:MAG: subfamily polymerase sigma-24 factor [Bacteroidetes bacterium]|nr:subfamily polymerase sigma-24 factor [Bacteroidota bacterium]
MTRREEQIATDEELISDAKSGDRSAFTSLVKRYEETVFRFSLKLCRDREKAEETLQDTFINVYRKLGSFDGKSKFSTWLYTIVANNCLMKRRKTKLQGLEEPLEALDLPAVSPDGRFTRHVVRWDNTPSDILLGKELRRVLDEAILKLPEIYRAVFVLRDVEGKSNEETAEVLHISQEAAKSRLRRARAFLREQLDPYMTSRRKGKP